VPEPAAASGIVVRFSQDCWVDIRDATRTFKLFGTMKAGSEHELGGEPPYKVVIGNAQAAAIRVGGEPFDLAPYTESNVARFTLKP
jgi:cytoskeleton protein RodZ